MVFIGLVRSTVAGTDDRDKYCVVPGSGRRASQARRLNADSMSIALKLVSELQLLRLQIPNVVLTRLDLDRHLLDDRQPEPVDAVNLLGVVGHDPQLAQPQVAEDLAADAVVALVDW